MSFSELLTYYFWAAHFTVGINQWTIKAIANVLNQGLPISQATANGIMYLAASLLSCSINSVAKIQTSPIRKRTKQLIPANDSM